MKSAKYDDYLSFLRESFADLCKFGYANGENTLKIKRILKDLNDPDPFVLYQASIAATIMLEATICYH